jgi:hypothetical protein
MMPAAVSVVRAVHMLHMMVLADTPRRFRVMASGL